METIRIESLAALPEAAAQLLEAIKGYKVVLFYGEMGMGKTTLIKEICQQLGVQGTVSSPTFSIVNEYAGKDGPIFHFDFYRINQPQEALDLGYEEYFYSSHYCFVEWPEKIQELLPEDAVSVHLHMEGPNARLLSVSLPG